MTFAATPPGVESGRDLELAECLPVANEPLRLSDLERSNLVAYLDGELPETEADYLRTKITQSVTARREIESLEKTWELLDYLPRPEAPEALLSRTMTQVEALDARGGKLEEAAGRAGRIAAQVLACVAVGALFLAAGYAATRWLWPDPTDRLVRELPLAEHLDEYRAVGSFEFLKLLDTSPALGEEAP